MIIINVEVIMMSLFEKIKAKLFRENNTKNQKTLDNNDEGLKELQKMAFRIQLDKEIKNASIQDKQEVNPVEKPVEESTDLTKEELK